MVNGEARIPGASGGKPATPDPNPERLPAASCAPKAAPYPRRKLSKAELVGNFGCAAALLRAPEHQPVNLTKIEAAYLA